MLFRDFLLFALQEIRGPKHLTPHPPTCISPTDSLITSYSFYIAGDPEEYARFQFSSFDIIQSGS